MICISCGRTLGAADKYCGGCGAAARAPDPAARLWGVAPVNTSWVAIVAGYLGLFAVTLVPAPLALGFGLAAIIHLRRHRGRYGWGRAWFAVAAGTVFTILLAFLLFIR